MTNAHINPWLHIWTEPRKTMRSILSTDPRRMVLWLAIVGGILSFLSFVFITRSKLPYSQQIGPITIGIAVIGGAILGIIHLYLLGWLYRLTGAWIGGKGTFIEVKSAVGWSNYPFIITSLISIISGLVKHYHWLVVILGLVNFVLMIWGTVIFFKLLSEAHQFSVWKGILTVLLAFVLIFAVVLILALLSFLI